MRERLHRVLLGYGVKETEALLSELEETLSTVRADGQTALDALQTTLVTTDAACTHLETEIGLLHETRAADLASLQTITDLRADVLRSGKAEIEAEELRLVTRLTRLEVQLGERRQRLKAFRVDVGRLIDEALGEGPFVSPEPRPVTGTLQAPAPEGSAPREHSSAPTSREA